MSAGGIWQLDLQLQLPDSLYSNEKRTSSRGYLGDEAIQPQEMAQAIWVAGAVASS